jgi:hypothetical protein
VIRRRDVLHSDSAITARLSTLLMARPSEAQANRGSEMPTTARIVMALDRVGRAGVGNHRRKRLRSL